MDNWKYYLILSLVCLVFQGFFAMVEMAFVSFNRVRLEYYVKQRHRKAIWLVYLLQNPTYLFATTLIGVNFFLQLGSESSRRLYSELGLNPDFAPITQIFAVLIFAELAPMFAARSHSEHVSMLGITPIYVLSKIFTPFILILNGICKVINWILRSPPSTAIYLSREELQKAIEAKDEKHHHVEREELDTLVQNIFTIKTKTPKELMIPLEAVPMVSYDSTAKEVSLLLTKEFVSFVPLYFQKRENLYGIIYARDLLKLDDSAPVREISRSPWFITEKNSIFQILKQFRWNNQQLAVVLDEEGGATGILTLDHLIEEIFHNTSHIDVHKGPSQTVIVDRTFLADKTVKEINLLLGIDLPHQNDETLEELMEKRLGHFPQKSEAVCVGRFELTLEEVPFLTDKKIRIRSL